jgi:hypothetical protein
MDADHERENQDPEVERQEAARAAATGPTATPPADVAPGASVSSGGTLIRDQVLRDLAAAAERQAAVETPLPPEVGRGRAQALGGSAPRQCSRTPPLETAL